MFAGFFATFILSIGTDLLLHAAGVFPPWGQPMSNALFVLAAAYRTVYTVAGGYVTARLAANKPMGHVWTLGVIGLLAAIAGTAATWDKGPEFGPKLVSGRARCPRDSMRLVRRQTCAARHSAEVGALSSM